MLKISQIRLCVIITLLFSISSIPVLGQISEDEIISGLFGIISGGSVSPGLVEVGAEKTVELVGNAYQYDEAVNSYKDACRYYDCGTYDLALMCIDKSIEAWEQSDYLQ